MSYGSSVPHCNKLEVPCGIKDRELCGQSTIEDKLMVADVCLWDGAQFTAF